MKSIIILVVVCCMIVADGSAEQQRILRRVIKSTPTATNLGRVRMFAIRSPSSGGDSGTVKGAVTEISGKDAASFGSRNSNETSQTTSEKTAITTTATQTKSNPISPPPSRPQQPATTSSTPSSTPASTPVSTTTTAAAPTTTSTRKPEFNRKEVERLQNSPEVEILANAPSWQTMTAVEAPAAMLIATGTRRASSSSSSSEDLSSSASSTNQLNAEESGDVLRSSAVKGGHSISGETFSRIRQQTSTSSKTSQQQQQQQQQSFFYPPSQPIRAPNFGKTSQYQATKTHWYQTTSTTPKPAPLIEEQQYEQQSDNYVEQQTEYGAAPLGQAEPFAFDFRTQDNSGNGQYRKEESDKNGVVHGSYGYTDANGIYRHVEYVADQNGFRANIKSNEPGLIGETQPASISMARGESSHERGQLGLFRSR